MVKGFSYGGPILCVVPNWYVLRSRLGAHTRGPKGSPRIWAIYALLTALELYLS